ncbi:MAG: hypothetical protein HY898_10085 [Deltaproteobacteria bacterium]|nr:hypothetical protein [Deltaproteobacteria bacterium]
MAEGLGMQGADYPASPYGLSFTAVGFLLEDGPIMHAMLVRSADSWPLALGVRPVEDGIARFHWDHVMAPGVTYHMDLFTSDDPFPECHMPPHRAWRVHLPEASADLDVYAERRDGLSPEACETFKSGGVER